MYVVCLIWGSGSLAVLHSYIKVPAVYSNWCNARRRQPRSWTDPELHSVLFYKKRFHNYRNKTFWSTVCLFYLGFGLFVLLHTYFGVNWCNARWCQPKSWTDPELHLALFYKKLIIRKKWYVCCLFDLGFRLFGRLAFLYQGSCSIF